MEVINNNQYKFIPTAGDSYGLAWNIMWKNFAILLAISIISSIISGPTSTFNLGNNEVTDFGFEWWMLPLGLFAIVYGLFIAGPIGYSTNWAFLRAVRGERVDIKDMFAVFQKNYWNAVGANVVVGLIIGFGFLMLIIPGIIFACRLAFVPFLVIDKEMELSEAISKSWEMTKGYGWHIFFMGFLAFWIVILGFLALFVGVFISLIWIQTAFAAMYHAVDSLESEEAFVETEQSTS